MAKTAAQNRQKTRTAGRPIGSSKQASLARILPAARKLFAEHGYNKTTLKDVGKAAGMTHAALYAYFPSKAALYQATCEHAQSLLLPEYVEAIAAGSTLKQQLRSMILASARAHDRDSSLTGLLGAIPLEVRRHPELAERLLDQQNATFQLLANAFALAQKRGEISKRSKPEDLVIAVLGATVGIALFQFGLQRSNLVDPMAAFLDLIEAQLFLD